MAAWCGQLCFIPDAHQGVHKSAKRACHDPFPRFSDRRQPRSGRNAFLPTPTPTHARADDNIQLRRPSSPICRTSFAKLLS